MTLLVIQTPNGPQSLLGVLAYKHPAYHPASMIEESEAKKFVSQDEKDIWNQGGSSYTHPETHPASMIEESEERLFITKDEKTLLNSFNSFLNPDLSPINPSAYDDEFNDGIITGWTDFNFADGTKIEENGCLKMKTINTSLSEQGIVKLSPSGNFTVSTKLMGAGTDRASHKYGLVIAESLTGKCFVLSILAQNQANGYIAYDLMNTPTNRSSYGIGPVISDISAPIYLKIEIYNDSGTWKAKMYYSVTGIRYYQYGDPLSIGFIPGYIGLIINDESISVPDYAWFDWFRVTE